MATQYRLAGTNFWPTSEEALNIHNELPPGNYIIGFDPMGGGFYFSKVAPFEMPSKIYGDAQEVADRIMSTFQDRSGSTGVLANGEKGSGKTLLTKMISHMGYELGMPTIIINKDWCGDGFNKLMQDITQPCIVLFDEFEKTYDREHQQQILTLLDGVFPTRKLFLFTCNDKYMIDIHMSNRPGRIYYMLDYKGLKADFIQDYCEDNLNDKQWANAICNIASTFEAFNFDILKALVEEMNRYNESPFEALKMLNATPAREKTGKFTVTMTKNGEECERAGHQYQGYELQGTPVSHPELKICYSFKERYGEGEHDWSWESNFVSFSQNDLETVDAKAGKFIYNDGAGHVVTFTRKVEEEFNLAKFAQFAF